MTIGTDPISPTVGSVDLLGGREIHNLEHWGLTKREWFVGQALAVLPSLVKQGFSCSPENVAVLAVSIADAVIKRLSEDV